MPSPTCTLRAASSIAISPAHRNWARCGCRCRTCSCCPLCRSIAGGPTELPASFLRRWPTSPPAWASIGWRAAGCSPRAAALALAFFALNPNLLYLQTTAMTEPLFVCEMIWIVVWLVEWRAALDRRSRTSPTGLLVPVSPLRWWPPSTPATTAGSWRCWHGRHRHRAASARPVALAHLLDLQALFVVAAPMAWFVYNAVAFGDWLEFARGPYSAKAIELRTASHGAGPPHPGWHNPWVSLLFFIKVSEMDAVAAAWGNALLALSVLGTAWAWLTARRRAFTWALLSGCRFPSTPIRWPTVGAHLSARLVAALLVQHPLRHGTAAGPRAGPGLRRADSPSPQCASSSRAWAAMRRRAALRAGRLNAWQVVRERPLVYVEGTKNIDARRPFDEQIPPALRALLAQRPGGTVLMDTSVYPEIWSRSPAFLCARPSTKATWRSTRRALAAPAAHAAHRAGLRRRRGRPAP